MQLPPLAPSPQHQLAKSRIGDQTLSQLGQMYPVKATDRTKQGIGDQTLSQLGRQYPMQQEPSELERSRMSKGSRGSLDKLTELYNDFNQAQGQQQNLGVTMKSHKSLQSKLAGARSQQNLDQSGVTAITGMSIMKDLLAQQQAKPGINIGGQKDDDLRS